MENKSKELDVFDAVRIINRAGGTAKDCYELIEFMGHTVCFETREIVRSMVKR